MNKGMRNLLLVLCCGLIAASTCPALANDFVFHELSLDEQQVSDPELSEAWSRYEIAYAAWEEGLLCELLQSPDAGVRLLASAASDAEDQELVCTFAGGPVYRLHVLESVMPLAWNNPGALVNLLHVRCDADDESAYCDKRAISNRLPELEPDNAAFVLLPLSGGSDPLGDQDVDARDLLMLAAEATSYDTHWGDALYPAYEMTKAYLSEHPMPELGPELTQAASDAGTLSWSIRNPAAIPLVTFMAIEVAVAQFAYGPMMERCRRATSESDQPLVGACKRIAELMIRTGDTSLSKMIGQGLRYAMTFPDFVGADAESRDPNRWRRQLERVVQECRTPVMFNKADFESAPAGHLDAYVHDLSSSGEAEALYRAALREYDHNPSIFALDPRRCEEAFALDEEIQQNLVALRQLEWSDPNPALLSLAEALESESGL